MRRRIDLQKADALAVGAALIWGVNYPTVKLVLAAIPEPQFILMRFIAAFTLLVLWMRLHGENLGFQRRHAVSIAALGIVGVGVYNVIWTAAVHRTTAANAALLISTAPVFTGVYTLLMKQEKPSLPRFLGLFLAFAGVFLIVTTKPGAQIRFSAETLVGNLLALAGAVIFSFYAIVAKPLLEEYSPIKLTTLAMGFGMLVLIPYGLAVGPFKDLGTLAGATWLRFIYAVLMGTVVSYAFWYQGVRGLGPAKTVLYHYLVSVVSMVVGSLALAEKISAAQGVGALLVFAGLVCSKMVPNAQGRAETAQERV